MDMERDSLFTLSFSCKEGIGLGDPDAFPSVFSKMCFLNPGGMSSPFSEYCNFATRSTAETAILFYSDDSRNVPLLKKNDGKVLLFVSNVDSEKERSASRLSL
jgi:hypothetical protein